jgi:hypothetical protein
VKKETLALLALMAMMATLVLLVLLGLRVLRVLRVLLVLSEGLAETRINLLLIVLLLTLIPEQES